MSLTHERHCGQGPQDVDEVILCELGQRLGAARPPEHRLAGDLLRGQLQAVGAVSRLLASRNRKIFLNKNIFLSKRTKVL